MSRVKQSLARQGLALQKKADSSDLLVRLDLLFKKLMLLFAANSMEDQVSVESVRSASSLFDYVIATYEAIGARIGNTEVSENEKIVHQCIINYEKKRTYLKGDER